VPVSVIVAIVCGVGWLGTALWTRWRRSRTLPVDYAGPVPEVLRVLLRPQTRRDDPALLNAAILELAEAGVLRIEPADANHPAMVSPRTMPHASQLPDYQASVVSRLLHRQGVSHMPVPLTALRPDEDPNAATWNKEFHRQLQTAAADRGLLQRPIGMSRAVTMGLTELLVSVLAANALAHYWHGPGTLFPFIIFAVVLFLILAWASRIRPTPAGRAIAASQAPQPAPAPSPAAVPIPAQYPRLDSTQVMPPIRNGAAAQPAPDIRILPDQLRPLPKNQVWSAYGGTWHPLDLNTKETYAIRSGSLVVIVPIFFAILSLIGALVAKRDGDPTGTATFVFFSALPVILLAFVAMGMLRRRHLPKRAVIRGQVAKLWDVKRSTGENETRDYYCSLDVGRPPDSARLKIGRDLFGRMQVGIEVEVLVNPRRKSLKDIRFPGPDE
jgi:hypothetical protein